MNLKLSKTAIRELTRLYRGVLVAAIIASTVAATGAKAADTFAGAITATTAFMDNLHTADPSWDRDNGVVTGWGVDQILGIMSPAAANIDSVVSAVNNTTTGLAATYTLADSAVQTVQVNGTALTETDGVVNITVATGSDNGTIKVNGADVAVAGLGTMAYETATDYKVKDSGDGLTNTSGTVSVNAGNGLGINGTSKAVEVVAGNGIEVGASGVAVKAADSTISVTSGGVKVGTITDSNIADASISQSKINGLGDALDAKQDALVAANGGSGITVAAASGSDPATISVNAGNGLQINTSNAVEVKAGNGVEVGASGVAVKAADSSITVAAGGVSANVYADGGLQTTSNGIEVKINGNGLAKGSDGLSVVADNSTLEVGTSGLQIKDGGVTATQLAADAVETAKIKDGAVTGDKLAAAVSNNLLDAATTSNGLVITAGTDATAANIALKLADASLQETTDGLSVKLADTTTTKSGLQVDANGLSIKTGDTMTVTSEGFLNINYKATQFEANATDGLKILAGGIGTTELANSSVTSDKIADGNVTLAKLASDVATTTATADSTKLITSGGVYTLVNVTGTNNYIANGTDVAGNLIALDAQTKSNADDIAQNASDIADINAAITVAANGNYIKAADDVKTNLASLDTAIGSMADFASQNYATSTTSVAANLTALDTQVKTVVDDMTVAAGTYSYITAGTGVGSNLIALDTQAKAIVDDMTVADGTYNYITAGTGVGANLIALDTQVKANADKNDVQDTGLGNIVAALNGGTYTVADGSIAGGDTLSGFTATNLTAAANELMTDITVASDGNYITAGADVAGNLSALDDQVKTNADSIGDLSQLVDSNYAADTDNTADAVMALDSNLGRVEGRVDALDRRVHKMHHEMKSGFASLAALSGLVPNARSAGDTQISVGTGYYRGTTGFALGAFHHLNDSVMLNAGASYAGNGTAIFKGGVTFGF